MLRLVAIFLVVFGPMLLEARRAAANERVQRARGGIEPRNDVYAFMQVAYPGVFLAMLAEGAWRDMGWDGWFVTGLVILGTAKALKYWAISWLGERWTFRVLVPPGAPRVTGGPYAWMAHPNYVAVAGEIAGCAIAAHAIVSGPVAFVLFGLLMLWRIRVEERALGRK